MLSWKACIRISKSNSSIMGQCHVLRFHSLNKYDVKANPVKYGLLDVDIQIQTSFREQVSSLFTDQA